MKLDKFSIYIEKLGDLEIFEYVLGMFDKNFSREDIKKRRRL